jgi:formylglycine-generating enzyme required for sulfatase activity
VTGGTFYRTYNTQGSLTGPPAGGWTDLADQAMVSGFRLDKYLVTVGRFRRFVTAWNGGSGWTPPAGSGKHTHLYGGQGLANGGTAGTYETGWVTSDNGNVAPTDANMTTYCSSGVASTWTPSAGSNENLPINCVDWYDAYAFCIWDGGFLASEAELEYAAAGGGLPAGQREFPWGTMAPGMANQYAIYGDGTHCYYPTGTAGPCTNAANIAPVGTPTLGAGLWGQLDMAGELWEWTLDWFTASYVNPCKDCASLNAASDRTARGGYFADAAGGLLPTSRTHAIPSNRNFGYGLGLRCARTP